MGPLLICLTKPANWHVDLWSASQLVHRPVCLMSPRTRQILRSAQLKQAAVIYDRKSEDARGEREATYPIVLPYHEGKRRETEKAGDFGLDVRLVLLDGGSLLSGGGLSGGLSSGAGSDRGGVFFDMFVVVVDHLGLALVADATARRRGRRGRGIGVEGVEVVGTVEGALQLGSQGGGGLLPSDPLYDADALVGRFLDDAKDGGDDEEEVGSRGLRQLRLHKWR